MVRTFLLEENAFDALSHPLQQCCAELGGKEELRSHPRKGSLSRQLSKLESAEHSWMPDLAYQSGWHALSEGLDGR